MFTRLCAAVAAFIGYGTSPRAQTAPPVRDLGPTVATLSQRITTFYGLHQFADGRVMVNDYGRRTLVIYDSTLANGVTIADTMPGSTFRYGATPSPLLPYAGDSLLYVDFASRSLLVLGPRGTVDRVIAPPVAADINWIRTGALGTDTRGRLVYRSVLRAPPRVPGQPPPTPIDSAPIVRGDFERRAVDTLARIKIPGGSGWKPEPTSDGKMVFKSVRNPLVWVDDWALHADGSVAIVRGHDYHVDWITPDGVRSSSPKMPYDWRRLTDADKERMVDSARRAYDALPAQNRALTLDEAMASGVPLERLKVETHADSSKTVPLLIDFVPLSEIPDYIPPIHRGAVKADRDGSLWILPTTSARSRKGGIVYDVVNREGVLYERVELPVGRLIAGFGRGGVVYLLSGDRASGFTLEKARVR